jgi:spectrin beta
LFQARTHPDIVERLTTTEKRKQQLEELSRLRKQRLIDALSLYKLLSDADAVEAWIDEKVCLEFSSCIYIYQPLSNFRANY